MPSERELKFSIDTDVDAFADRLLDAFEGSGLQLERKGTLHHADRYYDDPRLSLSRAGVALRRRIGGGKIVATLKTRGQVTGAMHLREEIELPMEGRDWPEPIRERVARHADVSALKGRFELETVRERFRVVGPEGELAEISIDRVTATRPTGGRSVRFDEVEVEDMGGGEAALERIEARLLSVAALEPSAETKLERARRLLLGVD